MPSGQPPGAVSSLKHLVCATNLWTTQYTYVCLVDHETCMYTDTDTDAHAQLLVASRYSAAGHAFQCCSALVSNTATVYRDTRQTLSPCQHCCRHNAADNCQQPAAAAVADSNSCIPGLVLVGRDYNIWPVVRRCCLAFVLFHEPSCAVGICRLLHTICLQHKSNRVNRMRCGGSSTQIDRQTDTMHRPASRQDTNGTVQAVHLFMLCLCTAIYL